MPLKIPKRFFITGTDTGIGKTTVTTYLIKNLQSQGFTAIGCKPIACGIENEVYEDVLAYETNNSLSLPREWINPLQFRLPASPNIAANAENYHISLPDLVQQLSPLHHLPVDYIFYEGVGGWKVPLNNHETTIDLARYLEAPIILVAGIKVGGLNHALLTYESIIQEKLPLLGWIANIIQPLTPAIDEHINTLRGWISAPYLGKLRYISDSS